MSHNSCVLVIFYASWCGNCNKALPSPAAKMKEAGVSVKLAAVDCTIHQKLSRSCQGTSETCYCKVHQESCPQR